MEQDAYKKDFLEYEGVKDAIDYAREEGEARGLAEGEEKEKRHTVLKMLSLGIDISTIVAVTGLSEDDIEHIRSNEAKA